MAGYCLSSVLSVFKDRDKKITRATGVDAVGIRVTKVAAFPASALDPVRQWYPLLCRIELPRTSQVLSLKKSVLSN